MSWRWLWGEGPNLSPEQTLLSPGAEPPRKPRIIISMDRSWHNILGITWVLFYHMIRRAGGVSRPVDYGTGPEPDNIRPVAREIINQGDGLLLSGGSDVDPKLYNSTQPAARVNARRDRFEMALIQEARAQGKPILGICRGCQLLNVAMGGDLHTIRANRDMSALHNRFRLHAVELEPGSRVAAVTRRSELSILSIHGQAVRHPAPNLQVVGTAADQVIEAVESPADSPDWLLGVQWHPEFLLYQRPEHRLIQAFVDTAAGRKQP